MKAECDCKKYKKNRCKTCKHFHYGNEGHYHKKDAWVTEPEDSPIKQMKAKRKIASQIRIWIAIENKLPNDVFTMAQISKEANTSWATARHIFHDIESLKRIKKYGKIGKAVLYQRSSKDDK